MKWTKKQLDAGVKERMRQDYVNEMGCEPTYYQLVTKEDRESLKKILDVMESPKKEKPKKKKKKLYIVNFESESGDDYCNVYDERPTDKELYEECFVIWGGDYEEDVSEEQSGTSFEDFSRSEHSGCLDGIAQFDIEEVET